MKKLISYHVESEDIFLVTCCASRLYSWVGKEGNLYSFYFPDNACRLPNGINGYLFDETGKEDQFLGKAFISTEAVDKILRQWIDRYDYYKNSLEAIKE